MNQRRLSPDERNALRILARASDGCTKASLLAEGLTIDILADFIHKGLASSRLRLLRGPGRGHIEVVWMLITAAGTQALAER
jgi:hypothetical protein